MNGNNSVKIRPKKRISCSGPHQQWLKRGCRLIVVATNYQAFYQNNNLIQFREGSQQFPGCFMAAAHCDTWRLLDFWLDQRPCLWGGLSWHLSGVLTKLKCKSMNIKVKRVKYIKYIMIGGNVKNERHPRGRSFYAGEVCAARQPGISYKYFLV